jgi:2-(1,2-epoxy-1,2-dihydrophenyl)acetyl-CoA isomerase
VADADFQGRFQAYCQSLCDWSPITLRLLKRGMVKSYETPDPEVQLRYEVSNIRIAFASEDAKEARQAFFEKRKPVFKGR